MVRIKNTILVLVKILGPGELRVPGKGLDGMVSWFVFSGCSGLVGSVTRIEEEKQMGKDLHLCISIQCGFALQLG